MDVIIDTDPGVDDVLAILYAFKAASINVRAIITTHGNTTLSNVDTNLKACLEVMSADGSRFNSSEQYHAWNASIMTVLG